MMRQNVALGFVLDAEGDVGDSHHFAALSVDDLLVQKIADQPQHIFIGMVGRQDFVAEIDSIQADGANLVVPDREPGPSAADQEAVYSRGMNQGDDGGVAYCADLAALQVMDLEAKQFGEKEDIVRHRDSPEPIN